MQTFEIIPAIDLIGGKCVRLRQGDYGRISEYADDPVEVSMQFQELGIRRLHLVDLEGARDRCFLHWEVLENIARATQLQIDASGGVQTAEDVQRLLNCGASWVSVGSIAVSDPELFSSWLDTFGAARFLLGADVKHGHVMTRGWLFDSGLKILDLIGTYYEKGLKGVFVTDISKDGMMQGPSVSLYQEILSAFPDLSLIASGGVSQPGDITALRDIGCVGAIIGKALYEGAISSEDITRIQYAG